jgi:hypothetical protein
MKQSNSKLIFASLSLAMISSLFVGNSVLADRINERQERQTQRIENGVKNGDLNSREANRLNKLENAIERKEERLSADGSLSRKDKVKLNKSQNKLSKRIFREKHDRQSVH